MSGLFSLEGRVALVTGASQGGTGTAIAVRLAAEGAKVAVVISPAYGREILTGREARVQILVDGHEVDTLAGHVDLRRPLARGRARAGARGHDAPGDSAAARAPDPDHRG